jgi:hypothetical protein
MRGAILAAALVLAASPAARAGATVTCEQDHGRLAIRVAGRPFAVYVWDDPAVKRPYFMDVRSPSGVALTRAYPPVVGRDATDHATMHPGLWLAFGDLDGADFWRNKGSVRHAGFVEAPAADATGARFAVRNVYEAGGRAVCEEVCRIRITPTPHGTRIDWRSDFRGPAAFAFGDQEEMGLGVRGAVGVNAITSGEGRAGERYVWGRAADWCDLAGPAGGVLLMPDPRNVRRCWFHARDYGLLVANPFGRNAFTKGEPSRIPVAPGATFTLRFGILVHEAGVDREAAYAAYLASRPDD